MRAGPYEINGLSRLVDGGDGAVARAGERAGAFGDLLQDGIEVEARADAQACRAQPEDARAEPRFLPSVGRSLFNGTPLSCSVPRAIQPGMGRIQCSRRPSDGLSCQHVNNDISKLSRILVTVTIIVLNSHIFHTIFCKNTGHLFARCTGGPERAGKGFEDLRRVRCARRRVCWGGAGNRSVEAAGLFGVGSALPAGGRQMAAWDAGDKWLGSTLYGDEQTASPYGTATPTRSKYAALRARGHCRDRALCGEADRLLSVASARVVSRTMFEPIVRHRAPSYPQGNTRPGGALLSELPARRYGLRNLSTTLRQ